MKKNLHFLTAILSLSVMTSCVLTPRETVNYYVSPVPSLPSLTTVSGRNIMVQHRQADNTLAATRPFLVTGVTWNPVPAGSYFGYFYPQYYKQDLALMRDMHANAIRTYQPLALNQTSMEILNLCYEYGIYLVMDVGYSDPVGVVNYFKNHPAILGWCVGNEWNENWGYGAWPSGIEACKVTVQNIATAIRSADPNHVVISSLVDPLYTDPSSALSYCTAIDVWSYNVYLPTAPMFSNRIIQIAAFSSKPYFFSEFGQDAYNAPLRMEDQASQATGNLELWNAIVSNCSTNGGVCAGGLYMEFSDEWWKYSSGNHSVHETNGFYLGTYDGYANEEYWGFVDIDRNPRQTYFVISNAWYH